MTIRERLELFVARTKELREKRLIRNNIKIRFTISWDAVSQELRYQALEPEEEDLCSFLLLFRQFISKDEPVFINLIFNDCLRFLGNDELKEELRKAKDEWKRIFTKMGAIQIVMDGHRLTPEYVLDLWINGHYFHNDPAKTQELHSLMTDHLPLVRMQLLTAIPDLTHIILYVGNAVTYGLKENLFHFPDEAP